MTRLPSPGSDDNVWGDILNQYLLIAHNPDGTIRSDALTKSQVGLSRVDNTSDAEKPISSATQAALDGKVTKNTTIVGATKTKITYDDKGLVISGTDANQDDIVDGVVNKQYSTTEKAKLAGIEDNADVTDTANVTAAGAEMVTNRVTAFQATPDDNHYPTEKLLKDSLSSVQLAAGTTYDVLQYRADPLRVVATNSPPGGANSVIVTAGSNDTIMVTATHGGSTVYSQTYTIPAATYPAALSALTAIPLTGQFRFAASSTKASVYLDPAQQSDQEGYTVTVTGGTALAFLGFTAGQSATYDSNSVRWAGTSPDSIYEVDQLDNRVSVLEAAVATPPVIGNGLRQLIIPGSWLAAPSGATGTAGLGKTTATEIVKVSPVFITRSVTITDFAYEVTTGGTGSYDYYVVLYADAGLSYDWPGALIHRELINSTVGAATKQATLATPIVLAPGTYYLGIGLAGAVIEDATIRLVTTTACGVIPGLVAAGSGPGVGGRAPAGIIASWTDPTGPFPGPGGTGVGVQAAVPRAYMRVSF